MHALLRISTTNEVVDFNMLTSKKNANFIWSNGMNKIQKKKTYIEKKNYFNII